MGGGWLQTSLNGREVKGFGPKDERRAPGVGKGIRYDCK